MQRPPETPVSATIRNMDEAGVSISLISVQLSEKTMKYNVLTEQWSRWHLSGISYLSPIDPFQANRVIKQNRLIFLLTLKIALAILGYTEVKFCHFVTHRPHAS